MVSDVFVSTSVFHDDIGAVSAIEMMRRIDQ